MNAKKIGIFSIITIFILLLIPQKIVWGGNPYQTVPTIGPSRTPTSTATVNQTSNALATEKAVTATSFMRTRMHSTSQKATFSFVETKSKKTTIEASTAQSLTKTPESTAVVLLPSVSTDVQTPEAKTEKDLLKSIPACLFPLAVILLLVIVFLITKYSIKKTTGPNKTKE